MSYAQGRKTPSELENAIQLAIALAVKAVARRERRDIDKVQEAFLKSDVAAEMLAAQTDLWRQSPETIADRFEEEMIQKGKTMDLIP